MLDQETILTERTRPVDPRSGDALYREPSLTHVHIPRCDGSSTTRLHRRGSPGAVSIPSTSWAWQGALEGGVGQRRRPIAEAGEDAP